MDEADGKIVALIADLDSPDKRKVRAAVDALFLLATDSSELYTRLAELLSDPQRHNCWPLAYILGSLPNPSPQTLDILLETLGSPDSDIRWAIALLLVRQARTDSRVVDLLTQIVETGNATQRRMTIYCIRDLCLEDAVALPVLLKGLRDMEPLVRVASATALKARADLSSDGRSLLLKVFANDPDFRVRSAAAITLAGLGEASEEFLTALSQAIGTENPQIKKAACAALALLEKKRSAPSVR